MQKKINTHLEQDMKKKKNDGADKKNIETERKKKHQLIKMMFLYYPYLFK